MNTNIFWTERELTAIGIKQDTRLRLYFHHSLYLLYILNKLKKNETKLITFRSSLLCKLMQLNECDYIVNRNDIKIKLVE